MRPWLLLVSLLLSDLSLLGDGDWITDYFYWPLCRKLLLGRPRAPSEKLHTAHSCPCLHKYCVYMAEQQMQRSLSFYWTHRLHYSNREPAGIIQGIRFPALAVASVNGAGKHFPAFLEKSNLLPALHVISEPVKIPIDVIINSLDFLSPWLRRPSSRNFPYFLLEKSELRRQLIPDAELRKIGCCAATALIVVCSSDDRELKSAIRIKKTWEKVVAEPRNRQKDRMWKEMNLKEPLQSKIQTHKDNLLTFKEDSALQKSLWEQLSSKAASSRDADRVYFQGPPLLASKKNKGSIYRSQYAIRPATDNDIEYFRKELNTKEAEPHSLQGGKEAENPSANREKNGNQQILASRLQNQRTHQANYAETMPSKTDKSKCKCLVGIRSLFKLYLIDTMVMTDIRLAKKVSEVTATEENVAVRTTEEAKTTAEESVTPTLPSVKEIQTETTTARPPTEATTTKMEIQDTTEVFSQSSTTDIQPRGDQRWTTLPDPEPETDSEPRFKKHTTPNARATSNVQFSGLRMRDDGQVVATKHGEDAEDDEKGSENWAGEDRKPGLVHHGGESQTFSKSSEDIRKEDAEKDTKAPDGPAPLCRGLIDRTDAGWAHCLERRGGPRPNPLSAWETSDVKKLQKDPSGEISQNPLISDEEDHFYYFDGVLKRVQNNVRVYHRRQRRRRRSFRSREEQERHREILQNYIQRLIKRNQVDHLT
ncbi:uncharacterized protein LOC103473337 [Poecilia reticulata]|uniref:uncharacterized protein LOC103473337 n=1 Tax=Poecilia reticulata TaxID=8081 RepID=UPI0004A3C9FB|nr:PREDICTED: uncharacterized protein LOC103473337 [Poecilia reticulata]